jgi:hypothetical protein
LLTLEPSFIKGYRRKIPGTLCEMIEFNVMIESGIEIHRVRVHYE